MDERDRNLEKRRERRVSLQVPIKIGSSNFQIISSTKNISRSGLYCQVNRFVPVMSKLAVTLFVPLIVKREQVEQKIDCSAVVVRIVPEEQKESVESYHLGLFFSEIKDKDRDCISQYIKQSFFSGYN
ncbi:MAG: PilZ domain-containing protein [Candidatus Omnitrophica bacterium]|nr:PilZ domain-containing protein [Candidatus Omnitrophota bacterium]